MRWECAEYIAGAIRADPTGDTFWGACGNGPSLFHLAFHLLCLFRGDLVVFLLSLACSAVAFAARLVTHADTLPEAALHWVRVPAEWSAAALHPAYVLGVCGWWLLRLYTRGMLQLVPSEDTKSD